MVKDVLDRKSKKPWKTLSDAIIGGITIGKFDVWRVTIVKALHGYGPLLYRIAMQHATQKGSCLSSDPDGATSPAAQAVLDRFASEPGVNTIDLGNEHGDQRDVGYSMLGNESVALAKRYELLLAMYDKATINNLDELLDEALAEALVTFGNG